LLFGHEALSRVQNEFFKLIFLSRHHEPIHFKKNGGGQRGDSPVSIVWNAWFLTKWKR
jgi:hypothetical protein